MPRKANPPATETGVAEVTIRRRNIGYEAHAEYPDGTSDDVHLPSLTVQGAERIATDHMTKQGYEGVGRGWNTDSEHNDWESAATRLFRRTPTNPEPEPAP